MRRNLRILILTFTLVMLVVGPLAANAQDEIVIDFYFPIAVDSPIVEKMQEYADTFMEANPGIVVNPVYTGSYNQTRDTVQTEIAAEDVIVDVAVMLASDLFSFIEGGYIMPAQDFIDQMEDGEAYVADFFPALLANGQDETGMVWTIPFQRSTPVLYYNADLLAENGFEPPTNNEELLTIAQALTTEDRYGLLVPHAGDLPIWWYQSFVAAYGQPLVEEDPTTVYFNTPESLASVEFMTKLGLPEDQGGYGVGPIGGSQFGDTSTQFYSGQAAMVYHTSGAMRAILTNAEFEVGVSFLPSGPAGEDGTGYGAPTGGGNLYIFNDGTKSEAELNAAWQWILYLSSPEIQADFCSANGYIAARQSAWEIEPLKSLVEEFPQYAVARDQLSIAVKEFSAYRTIDLQNIINPALSSLLSTSRPLSEAATVLEEAQAQIDSLLEEYR